MSANRVPAARPLVVRCGAFGDMVLITALVRALAARFGTDVDLLTSGAWSAPLLAGQPGIGDLLTVRSRNMPYWLAPDQRRAVRALRARSAGPVWYCDGNEAALPLLERAGIDPARLISAQGHPLHPGEHTVEWWRRLSQLSPPSGPIPPPIDLDTVPAGCMLEVPEPARLALRGWLRRRGLDARPLLLVQIGNKRTMRRGFKRLAVNHKHWPLERWAEVLRFLRREHPDDALLLIGTGPEYALNQALLEQAGVSDAHNLADDLPIPRLVALLARARGLLTVDSGPAHAAAAVGCPQVVLFGKALVSLYRPWGVAGADVRVVTGMLAGEPSMLGIEAQTVMDACAALKWRPPP
jgi:ADP-heptose:LPS heptosyltransferase